jgi:hypothetical protein
MAFSFQVAAQVPARRRVFGKAVAWRGKRVQKFRLVVKGFRLLGGGVGGVRAVSLFEVREQPIAPAVNHPRRGRNYLSRQPSVDRLYRNSVPDRDGARPEQLQDVRRNLRSGDKRHFGFLCRGQSKTPTRSMQSRKEQKTQEVAKISETVEGRLELYVL